VDVDPNQAELLVETLIREWLLREKNARNEWGRMSTQPRQRNPQSLPRPLLPYRNKDSPADDSATTDHGG